MSRECKEERRGTLLWSTLKQQVKDCLSIFCGVLQDEALSLMETYALQFKCVSLLYMIRGSQHFIIDSLNKLSL